MIGADETTYRSVSKSELMNKHSVSAWNPIGWRPVRSPIHDWLECSWLHSVDCLLLIDTHWSVYCWSLICWSNLSYVTCLRCALCLYSSGIQWAAPDCSLVIPSPWAIQKVTLSLFLCISSSAASSLLSLIQPGSIQWHHWVRNNPLDRLLTHAFPCGRASLLCLALAVTQLQVVMPFPPGARMNYAGVVSCVLWDFPRSLGT